MTCPSPEIHLIGEIVVIFGNLELYLEVGIWLLLSGGDDTVQKLGQAITAEMSFDSKVNAFASMFRLRAPARAEDPDFKALIKSLNDAQMERNQIVHSAWTHSDVKKDFIRMKSSAKFKGLRHCIHTMTPERLKLIRDHIRETGNTFALFIMKHVQDEPWKTSSESSGEVGFPSV